MCIKNNCKTLKTRMVMKRFMLLFSVALAILSANAQDYCPTSCYLRLVQDPCDASNVEIEVQLENNSQNLNAFILKVQKPELSEWLAVTDTQAPYGDYFTSNGYAKYILACWEGKTDEEREEGLIDHVDIYSAIRDNNTLEFLEVLKTLDCHYFPKSEYIDYTWQRIPVGKFAIDMTNLEEDYPYIIYINYSSFAFTGGPEGTRTWEDFIQTEGIHLYKIGNYVSTSWNLPPGFDAIEDVSAAKSVSNVKYYNLQGVESSEPFKGMNIKVTTYSDGTRKSEKELR